MAGNPKRLLIVEDDPTQGKALQQAFSRSGYVVTLCTSSTAALAAAHHTEFHVLIVDCMLPKINGVDLVVQIQEQMPRKAVVFIYSGVFKDKKFVRDTMKRTGAEAFLPKPLDLPTLLTEVNAAIDSSRDDNAPPLIHLYSSRHLEEMEVVEVLEAESPIHAFHLPIIYQRLQETTLSGELTLIPSHGEPSSVQLHEGRIFSVRTPDKESFFGAIAVEKGFVSSNEVMEALDSNGDKPIGERLIESMYLSPHAIQLILSEQLALRLSLTIQNQTVTLKWTKKDFPVPGFHLNEARFQELMRAWLKSKVEMEWLHSTLNVWGAHMIEGHFHKQLQGKMPLEKLLAAPEFQPARDLPRLLAALWAGDAFLSPNHHADAQEFDYFELRLTQFLEDMQGKNHFELLGLGEKSQMLEIKRAYEAFAAAYDPSRLVPNCPPDLIVKSTQVFQRIQEAYKVLTDEGARGDYLNQLEGQRSELLFSHEPIFRSAVLEIQMGNPKVAAEKFQTLLDQRLKFRDLKAFRIWAGLKCNRTYAKISLDEVPPEERHSFPYMMAKGLSLRVKGRYQKAAQAFKTAQMVEPKSPTPRAELEDLRENLRTRGIQRQVQKEITEILETLPYNLKRSA